MLFSFITFSLLCVNAVYSLTTPVTNDLIPLGDYTKLKNLCEQGGKNTYVAVRFGEDKYITYDFNVCYPYQIGSDQARQAVFCKFATCYNNPNLDCTGGAVPPVPVPVTPGLTLPNVADFVQLLGQGATCHSNGLTEIASKT